MKKKRNMSIIYRCRFTAQNISVLFILFSYSFGHFPLTKSDNSANEDIDSRDTPNEVIREDVRRDISISNIPKTFGIKHLNIFYDDDTFIQPSLNKRSSEMNNKNEQLPRNRRALEEETIDIVHVDVEDPDEDEGLVEGSDYNAAVARRDAEEEPIDVGQYDGTGLNGHMVDLLDENIFAAAKPQLIDEPMTEPFQDSEELTDDIHVVQKRNAKSVSPRLLSSISGGKGKKHLTWKNYDGQDATSFVTPTKVRVKRKRKKWQENDDEDPIPGLPRGISEILDRTWTDYWKYFTKRSIKKRDTNLALNPKKGMLLVQEPKPDKYRDHIKEGDALNEDKNNVTDVELFGSVGERIKVSDDETNFEKAEKSKKAQTRDTFKVLFSHDEHGYWDNEYYGKKKKKKKRKDPNVEDTRDESTRVKGYQRFRGRNTRRAKYGGHAEFHRPYSNVFDDLIRSYHGEFHNVRGVNGLWTGQNSAHAHIQGHRLKKSLREKNGNTNNERIGKRKKRDENSQNNVVGSNADLEVEDIKLLEQPKDAFSSLDENKKETIDNFGDIQDESENKDKRFGNRDERKAPKSASYPGQGARHRPYQSILNDLMSSYHGEYHKANKAFGWTRENWAHLNDHRLKKSLPEQTENTETNNERIGKRKKRDENSRVISNDVGYVGAGMKTEVGDSGRDSDIEDVQEGSANNGMDRDKRKTQKLVGFAGHDEHHAPFSSILDDLISPYHGEFHSVHRVNSQWTGKKWASSKGNRLKKSIQGQTEYGDIETDDGKEGKRKKREENGHEQVENMNESESSADVIQRDTKEKDTGVGEEQGIDVNIKDKRKAKEKPQVGYRGIDEHHKPFNSFWTGLMSPVHADFKNVHRIQHQFDGPHRGILGRDIGESSQTGSTETEDHGNMGRREDNLENDQMQSEIYPESMKNREKREHGFENDKGNNGNREKREHVDQGQGENGYEIKGNREDSVGNLVESNSGIDTNDLTEMEDIKEATVENEENGEEVMENNENTGRYRRKMRLLKSKKDDPHHRSLYNMINNIGINLINHEGRHIPVMYPLVAKDEIGAEGEHYQINNEDFSQSKVGISDDETKQFTGIEKRNELEDDMDGMEIKMDDGEGNHGDLNGKRERFKRKTKWKDFHHDPYRQELQDLYDDIGPRRFAYPIFNKERWSREASHLESDKETSDSEIDMSENRERRHHKAPSYKTILTPRSYSAQLDRMDDGGHHSHHHPMRGLFSSLGTHFIGQSMDFLPFKKIDSSDVEDLSNTDTSMVPSEQAKGESLSRNKRSKFRGAFLDRISSQDVSHHKPLQKIDTSDMEDFLDIDDTLLDSEPINGESRVRNKRYKIKGAMPLGKISSQDVAHHKPLRDLMNSVDPGIIHHIAHSFPFNMGLQKGDNDLKTISGDNEPSLDHDFQNTHAGFTDISDKSTFSDPSLVHGFEEVILPQDSLKQKTLKKRNSEVEGYHHSVPPMDELDLDNALATFEHMFKDDITNKSRHMRNTQIDYRNRGNLGQRQRRFYTGNHHIRRSNERFIKSPDFSAHSRRIGRQNRGGKELHRRQSVGRLYGRHRSGKKLNKKRSFSAGQEGVDRSRRLTSMMEGNPLYENVYSDRNMNHAIDKRNKQHDINARSIHKFSLLEGMSPYSHVDSGTGDGSMYVLNGDSKGALAPGAGLYDDKKEPGPKPPALAPEGFDDEEENAKYQALLNSVSNAGFQQPNGNENSDSNALGTYYDRRLQKEARIEYPELRDKVFDNIGSFDFDRADDTDQQLRFSLNKKQERKKKSNELGFDRGASVQTQLQSPTHGVVRRQGTTTEADSELTEMVMKQLGMNKEQSMEATTSFSAKKRRVKAKREPFSDDDDLNHDDQNGIAEKFVDMEKEAEDEIIDPLGRANSRYKIARAIDADEGFHDVRIPIQTQFYKTMNKGDNDYLYPYNATKYIRSQEEKRKKMAILQELKDKNAYEEQAYATVIPLLTPYPSKPKNSKIYDLLNSLSEDDMGDNSVELIRSFYRTFPDEHNEFAYHHGPIVPRPPDYANKSIASQSGKEGEEEDANTMNQPPPEDQVQSPLDGTGVAVTAVTNSYTQINEIDKMNEEENLLKEVAHNISHIRLQDPRKRMNWTSYVQRYQSEYKKNPMNDTGKYVTQLNRSYPHVHDTLIDLMGSRNKAIKLFPLKSGESPPTRVDTGWARMLAHENSHPYIKDVHPYYSKHTALSNPLKKRDKEIKLNPAEAFKKKRIQARDIETILKPFHRKVCHPSLLNLRPTIYLERRDIGATQIGKGSYFADVAYHTKSTKNGTKLQTGDYNLLYYFRHNVILTKILALDPEFSPSFDSPTAQPLLWNLGFTISIHDFVTDRYGKKLHYTLPMQSYTLPSQPRAVAVLSPPIRADAIRFYPTPKVEDQMEWNWPNFKFKGCVIT